MYNKVHAALLAGSGVWCLSLLIAPVAGLAPVYDLFSMICHQQPDRSWHLFSEPMPVCIRCASIYFAFLFSLVLNLPPNVRWLRVAVIIMAAEFLLARLFIDAAAARAFTGMAFGAAAAPFIEQGIGELSGSL